jgi:hypothetical protein
MQDITYDKLMGYESILVYGAGAVGSRFLFSLYTRGVDNSKVTVWDERYDSITDIFGFSVLKPDFRQIAIDENTIVIIALSTTKNKPLADEIRQAFVKAKYKHIVMLSDVDLTTQTYNVNDFENVAYEDCTYQNDMDFSELTPLVKTIAFYLPQFHETPENNEWWGKGFTEWTNTSKAKPRFQGHYQPRIPHKDFGYYDLSDVDVIRKQAELAKRHGIYGWSIYYYWFSGKTLLSKPLDLILENKDIDIKFCLTWCNESWTKIWVGDHTEELIKCEYRKDDPERFIDDFKKYSDDDRYIRFNGKPLILVYKSRDIPNVQEVIQRWRKRALSIGIGEISIFTIAYPYITLDKGIFDGETAFHPAQYAVNAFKLEDIQGTVLSRKLYRYAECTSNYKYAIKAVSNSFFYSCMCGWDNSPRYNREFSIYDLEFSLNQFYKQVKFVTEGTLTRKKEFIFVFAWNEWAEGAYLEPDVRFGYTMLNSLSKAICGLPLEYT